MEAIRINGATNSRAPAVNMAASKVTATSAINGGGATGSNSKAAASTASRAEAFPNDAMTCRIPGLIATTKISSQGAKATTITASRLHEEITRRISPPSRLLPGCDARCVKGTEARLLS